MATPIPVLLSWSSGKDSAWALQILREDPNYEVVALLTTFGGVDGRVPFQNATAELVVKQANALGLPIHLAPLPRPCGQSEYESAINMAVEEARTEFGIDAVAFADVFREDLKVARTNLYSQMGLEPIYPLWGKSTRELADQEIAAGLKAKITCVRLDTLPKEFIGRDFDAQFQQDLPESVDPCGEQGGFRTFAYDGPMFRHPVRVEITGMEERDGYCLATLK